MKCLIMVSQGPGDTVTKLPHLCNQFVELRWLLVNQDEDGLQRLDLNAPQVLLQLD